VKFPLFFVISLLSLLITTHKAIAADEHAIKILVMGDSLSAAYGIPKERGWVNLLQEALATQAEVINASISGETTGGGLAAFPKHLANYEPDIVLLALGANDGLRGFPPQTMKSNLEAMVVASRDAGARVLMIGIHILPNYGKRYTKAFYQVYESLVDDYQLGFVPFLLEGVALNPELMQDDQLHPTAEAQPIILANVLPYLEQEIDEITSQ
jgi:acyl-CoA thioesterase-1